MVLPNWSTLLFVAQNLTSADVLAARFQRLFFPSPSHSPSNLRGVSIVPLEIPCYDALGIPVPCAVPVELGAMEAGVLLGRPVYESASSSSFPQAFDVDVFKRRATDPDTDPGNANNNPNPDTATTTTTSTTSGGQVDDSPAAWFQNLLKQRTDEILASLGSTTTTTTPDPDAGTTDPPPVVGQGGNANVIIDTTITTNTTTTTTTTTSTDDNSTVDDGTTGDTVTGGATTPPGGGSSQAGGCFPAVGFQTPATVPSSTDGWWCDETTEYGFLGFSYPVQNCETREALTRDFTDIKQRFKGRYIRLYAACDREGFYDDVVEAAWTTGIGVHALIWFGWDDPNKWQSRRDALYSTIRTNPKARFVTRVIQFGSEPLYDSALDPRVMISEIQKGKESLGIPFTISDLRYGFEKLGNPGLVKDLMASIDVTHAHILPFFAHNVDTAAGSWPLVKSDMDWFLENGSGKKVYFSQCGWPSVQSQGISPNSPNAVASVSSEQAFYEMLDSQCPTFKATGRGVGWFAHFYSDKQGPGYGIYNNQGELKFAFSPSVSC